MCADVLWLVTVSLFYGHTTSVALFSAKNVPPRPRIWAFQVKKISLCEKKKIKISRSVNGRGKDSGHVRGCPKDAPRDRQANTDCRWDSSKWKLAEATEQRTMNRSEAFKLISECVLLSTASFSVYYLLSTFLGDPSHRTNDERDRTAKHLARLKNRSPELKKVLSSLSNYEKILLAYLVTPDDITVSFSDIGGLDDVVNDLRESVILPLVYPELFTQYGSLLAAPKGVLLYGPPGCGKTMLAKALAKESRSNFISIRMSTIMDKWFGESNKLVDALFSLAKKLQPCIIFIDEIDSFLRERSSTDHEVTATLKAEFMTLWDGLVNSGRVLVLGATNRPGDIDSAFLRRMPKRFSIGLPNAEQRTKILEKLLGDVDVSCDIQELVDVTEGMSGSDLKELCRNAAVNSTREYVRRHLIDSNGDVVGGADRNGKKITLRPLELKDFIESMEPDRVMKLKLTTDLD